MVNTKLLESMITDYKNHGGRVDEVLFHEVMKVLGQARKLEDQLDDKFMFINQGNEEQRYVDQERVIELENRVRGLRDENLRLSSKAEGLLNRNSVLRSDLTANRNLYELAVKRSKRYRKVIEKAVADFNQDEHQLGMAELQSVLEEPK